MNICKRIGNAIWLYRLFVQFVPDDWTGAPTYVAGGNVISDTELQAQLEVKPRTISVWRRKLKAAGLLDWLEKPGVGRAYVIAAAVEETKLTECKSAETPSLEPQADMKERLASPLVQ
jgi:hypothetical protein